MQSMEHVHFQQCPDSMLCDSMNPKMPIYVSHVLIKFVAYIIEFHTDSVVSSYNILGLIGRGVFVIEWGFAENF